MLKRACIALSALALVASASAVNAADVYEGGSFKDEPGFSSPYISWTGFYAGGQVGGAYDISDGDTLFAEDAVLSGGFHLGYIYQLSSAFAVGAEGDLDFLDDENAELLSSIRARLAWTGGPIMLYLTGGVGFIEVANEDIDPGFAFGGGIEYMASDEWSVGLETMYYNFEDPQDADQQFEIWTTRARLSYHFSAF